MALRTRGETVDEYAAAAAVMRAKCHAVKAPPGAIDIVGPAWAVQKELASMPGFETVEGAYGQEVVTDLCRKLIAGGAPGLHFYTLNRAKATLGIVQGL